MICRKAVLSRGKSSGKCSFERLAHGIVVPCSEDWIVENAVGFIKVTVWSGSQPASARQIVIARTTLAARLRTVPIETPKNCSNSALRNPGTPHA